MVELPMGNIIEERRGGTGALSTLLNEMVKLGVNGYIRCERTPKDMMPRVGQVVIQHGEICIAIHEEKAILEGVDALIEIESDCQELDCLIQLIEDVDVQRIIDLHPSAKLSVENPEENESSQWWETISTRKTTWTKSSKLPTIDASVDAPEFVRAKAASMVHRTATLGINLGPGSVYSNESDELFYLASNLKNHGKPLLVISRKTREEVSVKFDIPADNCLWLSQKEGEGVQFVNLDAIKGTVYGFLEGNLRAVLLLDGLEYLANICGEKPVIEMIREISDRMRYEDDCLLISFDKSAWESTDSAYIIRAAPSIDTDLLHSWNQDPESLLDHPLMAPPTEEEILRLENYLEENTPQSFVIEEVVEDIIEETPIPHVVEPEIVPEILEVETVIVEEVEIVEEAEVVSVEAEKKGPRKAQRVKRRRATHARVLSDRETRLAGLSAVNKDKFIGDLPSANPLPKTAIGVGNEGSFKSISKKISGGISDAVRQNPSKKKHTLPATKLGPKPAQRTKAKPNAKVVSPLAARGIEIKRNLANRRQASSVPQREIDIDKELESWKKKEEEVE
ncbi:MAG: DUF835 domain-containing protein [Candidatus Poseidoniaceae archaeon]